MTRPSPAGRACGPCTLCCKVMRVGDLDKPAGAWCAHIAKRSGCRIYDSRPGACRTFSCVWLHEPGLPEALRPDKSKVVLHLEHAGRLVARCDPGQPTAWRQEPVYGMLKAWAANGWPAGRQVLAAVDDRYWALTPTRVQPDVDLGRLPPGAPLDIDLMSDGLLVVRPSGD